MQELISVILQILSSISVIMTLLMLVEEKGNKWAVVGFAFLSFVFISSVVVIHNQENKLQRYESIMESENIDYQKIIFELNRDTKNEKSN